MKSRPDDDPNAKHICDECGHDLMTTWHDHTFQHGSNEVAASVTVRLPVRRCGHCDFDFLDDEGERLKHEAVCRHLGVLTPEDIRRIREHLGLSRSALAKLTGVGEALLSQWENGIKIQSPRYDRCLRTLSATPPLHRR